MKQLTSAIKPAVTGVQVHCEGSEAIEVAPFPIPPLFISQFTYIFMKNAAGGILIEGKVGDDEFEEGLEPIESDIHIDKLFAFYNIRDLEESITFASEEEKEKIRQNVVKQSLMNGIVSQFTAMYNVNDGENAPQKITRQNAQAEDLEIPSNYYSCSQVLNARQMRGQTSYYGSSFEPDFTLFSSQARCSMSPETLCIDDDDYALEGAPRASAPKKKKGGFFSWIGSLFSKKEEEVAYSPPRVSPPPHIYCAPNEDLYSSDDALCSDPEDLYSPPQNYCPPPSVSLPSSDPPQSTSSTKESDEIVSEIMRSQEFEGYWKNMELVKKLANCEFEIPGLSGNQLITVFALALLEVYGDESIWLLIYNKALEWLNNQNSDYDWKKAIAEAKSKIKKWFR
jgi:hypothetical protein